jgi:hypothetical protein
MLYVIKNTKTSLYYVSRMIWTDTLDAAELFKEEQTAESHIELLLDHHAPEDMKIIPVTVVPDETAASLAGT